MRTLSVLLLCAAFARAQDPLLERLAAETRSVAARARSALLSVQPGAIAPPVRGRLADGAGVQLWEYHLTRSNDGHAGARGVLAGSPPRVLLPYRHGSGDADRVVALADGRTLTCTYVDGDADLGVAVYDLPAEERAGLEGLVPEADWAKLDEGTLGVSVGGACDLALVRSSHVALGGLDWGSSEAGSVLVGADGRLLGWVGASGRHSWAARWLRARKDTPDHAAADVPFLRSSPADIVVLDDLFAGEVVPGVVAGPVIHRVLEDIAATGRIRRSYLGVVLGDAGDRVVIASVLAGSPAAAAGLRAGQRVERVGGLEHPSSAAFERHLALLRPGEEVAIGVEGVEAPVRVKLGDRAEAQGALASPELAGLTCVDLGPELRRFLGLGGDRKGVVVQEVAQGSAAYQAGLRRGDVIDWGGGGDVADLEELRAAFAAAGEEVSLRWMRGDTRIGAVVRLPKERGASR